MQLRKQLRKAARSDTNVKIVKLDNFNPVAPKGLSLVSVSVLSETNMVTNYAKANNPALHQ